MSTSDIATAEKMITDELDWDRVIQTAIALEVEGLVFQNLGLHFSEDIPQSHRATIQDCERSRRASSLALALRASSIAGSFEQSGVPVIVFKGPAVAIAAYGDASLRGSSDIDFLVREIHLSRARDVLVSAGYVPMYEAAVESTLVRLGHALEFSKGTAKVELHSLLLSGHLHLIIDTDENLWRASREMIWAGSSIRVLSPEHGFLFLCAHGAKHEWRSMRWILDVALFARTLDRDTASRIMTLAKTSHAVRIVSLAVGLADHFFGGHRSVFPIDLPDDSKARALQDLVEESFFQARSDANSGRLAALDPRLGPLMFWLRARERLIDRAACLSRLAFVPTDSDSGVPLIDWFIRPARLATHALRRIGMLTRRDPRHR